MDNNVFSCVYFFLFLSIYVDYLCTTPISYLYNTCHVYSWLLFKQTSNVCLFKYFYFCFLFWLAKTEVKKENPENYLLCIIFHVSIFSYYFIITFTSFIVPIKYKYAVPEFKWDWLCYSLQIFSKTF